MLRALRALVVIALAHRDLRKMIAQRSIAFFAFYYFGIILTKFQIRWAKEALKSPRCLIIGPVGHGKTELIGKVLPIWLIANNKSIRLLMFSKVASHSIKNLMVIKYELRFNPRLIADYGAFYSSRNKWEQSKIQVVRPLNLKDYTVEAAGMDTTITGGRFEWIIGDDTIDRISMLNPGPRTKILEYVLSTVMTRLTPNGAACLLGTRKHYDDLYANLMKDPTWTVIHDRAIIREPADWEMVKLDKPIILPDGKEQFYVAVIHGEDRGECLWPEQWTMERLLLERFRFGTIVFSREYQGEVVDDETAAFRLQWLEQCRDEGRSYVAGALPAEVRADYRVIVLAFDPSLKTSEKSAEAQDSDYFVGVLYGLRRDGPKRDLLGLYRFRGLTPDAVQKKVLVIYTNGAPDYCAIETNSFGEILRWNLIHKTGIGRLIEHKTGKNKSDLYEGVPMMSPLFENGLIGLPYKTPEDKTFTEELIKEFHGLGVEPHDDIVMAIWIAETIIQRYLLGQARIEKQRAQATARK